ncbi:MAG: nucleotidyltransferase domain-containing protein [Ignavibacteriales bacterium]|nr:nucleotidyltransferase domain-containing protein [Ignavibacteriales bacterium]
MSESLKKALNIIIKVAEPNKIILFGSRATGRFTDESDYDLLVIKRGVLKQRELARKIYSSFIKVGASIDVLVVDYDRYEQLKNDPYLIYFEANMNGIVVYEQV